MAKEIQIAGPASGTDSPRITRMPVPRVAPTLIMVSCRTPKLRTRRGSAVAAFRFADHLPDRFAAQQLRAQRRDGRLRGRWPVRRVLAQSSLTSVRE